MAAAQCINAMVKKCCGAPHTPLLPAIMTSEYTQAVSYLFDVVGLVERHHGGAAAPFPSAAAMVRDVGSGLGRKLPHHTSRLNSYIWYGTVHTRVRWLWRDGRVKSGNSWQNIMVQ